MHFAKVILFLSHNPNFVKLHVYYLGGGNIFNVIHIMDFM